VSAENHVKVLSNGLDRPASGHQLTSLDLRRQVLRTQGKRRMQRPGRSVQLWSEVIGKRSEFDEDKMGRSDREVIGGVIG
jgi:hypothetical protein